MLKSIFNSLQPLLAAGNKRTKTLHREQFKKRHWLLGSTVIVLGGWITHTTTATVYDHYNIQQALAFADATPNHGLALNGGLPDELFVDSLRTIRGPISNGIATQQSPSNHVFTAKTTAARPPLDDTSYTVKRGDNLAFIFKKLGYDRALPYWISQHEIGKQLVSLSVGRNLVFGTNQHKALQQITYSLNPLQKLLVELDGISVVDAHIQDVSYTVSQKSVSSEIRSSLYEAAQEAGLSNNLIMEMVRIFGWDIDFVLDIRQGDHFHVVFEQFDLDGEKLADGNILAAEFTTQGTRYRAIRFADDEGNVSYYSPQGESMLGTFLRSPVEFSRISSRFGRRKHPILKKWRAHRGVDYAASRGTPIRATADGKVILAGRKGGYGNTIVLRHAGRFSTLYGHMTGFAKGVRSGKRVQQGDTIGYIGSSGLATGPHLHYEFRVDGVHRNPLSYKTPKASSINAQQRADFDQLTGELTAQLDTITYAYRLAQGPTPQAQSSHPQNQ